MDEQLRAIQLLVMAVQFDTGKDVLALVSDSFRTIRQEMENDNVPLPDGETVFNWVEMYTMTMLAHGISQFREGIRENYPELAQHLDLLDLTDETPAQTWAMVAMLENHLGL